jgi:hypothetical protein
VAALAKTLTETAMPPLIDLLKRIREFFVKNSDPFAHPFPVCTPKLECVGISNLTFD